MKARSSSWLLSRMLGGLMLAALALLAPSARAGGQLPEMDLSDFSQTKAKTFDDFAGRAVLIEFFAYW